MNIITLDFETYFDEDYTLRKMTTESYIRDPRFEALMVGIDDVWYGQEQIVAALDAIDWPNTAIVAHHAHFDGLILWHHFKKRPGLWLDTLSMARQVIGNHVSVSLDSVAKHFNLSAKTVPYDLFRGKHWHQIDDYTRRTMGAGCVHDCQLTKGIFDGMATEFPAEEYQIVDITVRMFTEPCIVGDTAVLAEQWQREHDEKARILAELNVTDKDLRSPEKFATLLRALDIEPATRTSPTTGDTLYDFAKTSDFMQDLLEHEDDAVRVLAEARIAINSAIAQTRAERLGWMATRGAMCVYLLYAGAHTTRWSGGDKVNWQNFPRPHPEKPALLRRAMTAPPGYKLGVIDLSQIECRILNYFAGQWDVIEKFARKEDPYTGIASHFYGFEVTKAMPRERGMGKQLELSCGFGAGAFTIAVTAKKGTYGPPVVLTDEEALRARDTYRSTHPMVVALWKQADQILHILAGRGSCRWGPLRVDNGRIYGPNGGWINYRTLEWHVNEESGESYWRLKTRRGWRKIYGGALVENVVQFMARIVMSQAMLRINAMGIKILNSTHDELTILLKICPEIEEIFQACLAQMKQTPVWLPGIPLDAEGAYGDRYEK